MCIARTRQIVTVWSADTRRSHINEYRPNLFHPELTLVRFSATVEVMADSAAHRPNQESAPLHGELAANQDGRAAECVTEAQEHQDTHIPTATPVSPLDHMRYASKASLPAEPVTLLHPKNMRGGSSGVVRPHDTLVPYPGVPVSRRARVEKLIQHGVERDPALRFEALTQGWIERITA